MPVLPAVPSTIVAPGLSKHTVDPIGSSIVAQQYLRGGLIDETEIHVVPVLLGEGVRLFENTEARQTDFECVRVINSHQSATTNIN